MKKVHFIFVLFFALVIVPKSYSITIDFWLSVDDFGILKIDGNTIAPYDDYPWGQAYGSVDLTAGWHDISIQYKNRWGSNALIFRQKYPWESPYSIVPIDLFRSLDPSGNYIQGLKADYYDLSGNHLKTIYGEGPIHHQYISSNPPIYCLYEGQPGYWAGTFTGWSKFEERLSGQIYVIPEPGTIFLLGFGIFGIGILGWSQKRKVK